MGVDINEQYDSEMYDEIENSTQQEGYAAAFSAWADSSVYGP